MHDAKCIFEPVDMFPTPLEVSQEGSFTPSRLHLHHELLVVSHRAEQRLVQQVPGDVLHHRRVAREDGLGVDDLALLGPGADVPQADGLTRQGGVIPLAHNTGPAARKAHLRL